MSTLSQDYRQIGEQLAEELGRPAVSGIYLPAPVADETFRDEFGFVFLADGSVGPFYVSMGDILRTLWERHPDPSDYTCEAIAMLRGFDDQDLAHRALALGAYNALSASIMRRAGFVAPDRAPASGLADVPSGAAVGMVGYFGPLVDKLIDRGNEVLILERAPQRVGARPGMALIGDARELIRCEHIVCTAATLINDTLSEVLAAVAGHSRLELTGPSGSGLPDPLFARGIASVGGISFVDRTQLVRQLGQGKTWAAAGRKYQLTPQGYPGITALVGRLER